MTDYTNMVKGVNIAEMNPEDFPKVEAEYRFLKYMFNMREVEEEISVMIDSVLDLQILQALKDMISAYIKPCAYAEDPKEEYLRYIIKTQYIPAIITLLTETTDFMTVDLIFQLLQKGTGSGKNVESDI